MPATLRHTRVLLALLTTGLSGISAAQPASWAWSLAYDSGADEMVRDIAVNQTTGEIYLVGGYSASGPFGLPASAGGSDAFLVKLNSAGTVLWTRTIGGNGSDVAYGVTLAADGRVYITGSFEGGLSIAILSQTVNLVSAGGDDAFVACFSADGTRQWMEKAGGNQDDAGYSIAANASGVFVHGVSKGAVSFGGIAPSQSAANDDQVFVARYPFSGGTPDWVITGGGVDNDLAERIAADATGVYVTGSFEAAGFTWRSQAGVLLGSIVSAFATQNGYVSRITNGGGLSWTRAIESPSSNDQQFNAIATDGERVYIGGRCNANSIFPGWGPVSQGASADVLYAAALDAGTGNTLWVRTATGVNSQQTEVFDIDASSNGRILMSGSFSEHLAWDDGTTITGGAAQELFVSRIAPGGNLLWSLKESAAGNEMPVAVALGPSNAIVVGGLHTQQIRLSPSVHAGGSSLNAFIGRLNDPISTNTSPMPARWKILPVVCQTDAPINLGTRLRGHADGWRGTVTGVINHEQVLNAPNGIGATLAGAGSGGVLNLGDTILLGATVSLRVRSSAPGMPTRLSISFSLDGTAWTDLGTEPQFSNTNWHDVNAVAPIACRYLRVRISSFPPNNDFQLDGITFLNETTTGGTWTGPGVNAAGSFNPAGLVGWQSISYSVNSGGSLAMHTRAIWVSPPPTGIIVGQATTCPGGSAQLEVTGLSLGASVTSWHVSSDGGLWSILLDSSTTHAAGPITFPAHYLARLHAKGCPMEGTNTFVVTPQDTEAPVFSNCPPQEERLTDAGQCTNEYVFPVLLSDDNCDPDTEQGFSTRWLAAGSADWVDVTGWNSVQLSPGLHRFSERHGDDAGNTVLCEWEVLVRDGETPTLNCPGGAITLGAGAGCEALMPDLSGTLLVADNCPSAISVVQAPAAGTPLPIGNHMALFTIHANGDSATCTRLIDVVDSSGPSITCPGSVPNLAMGVNCTAILPDYTTLVTVTDNCPSTLTLAQSPSAGTPIGPGTHTISITASSNGQNAFCSITVQAIDDTPPSITCPAIVTQLSVGNNCMVLLPDYTSTAASSDNCPGSVALSQSPLPGTPIGVGLHTITLTATKDGMSTSCSFNVEARDDSAPIVMCPLHDEYPLYLSGAGCALIFPDLRDSLSVFDCSAWSITMMPAPGTIFTHDTLVQMTMWIEDAHGNGLWNNHTIRITGQTSSTTTASACDSYQWAVNGNTYFASGTYSHVVGCHTETLVLTITPGTSNSTTASACDSYQWAVNGNTYFTSGIYTHVVGCHTETLVLTITQGTSNSTTASACDSYEWAVNGNTYFASGTYTHVVGCHTETLVLTITQGTSNSTTASACNSYQWAVNGNTYFASGTYTHVAGCHTETLVLTITPGTSNSTTTSACNSYTWAADGNTYFTSGTYTHVVGCHTETLVLTITTGTSNSTTASACDSYEWAANGNTYFASGTYTHVAGCHTETLVLTIATPGQACDDGNPNTANDTLDALCNCSGNPIPVDCLGIANGQALPGTPCDDGDTSTSNDTWDSNCNCVGTPEGCSTYAGVDQQVCGLSATLEADGEGVWSGPAAISFSSATDPTAMAIASMHGTFELHWTSTIGSCVASDTVSITFLPISDAAFAYAQSAYCQGDASPSPWTAQSGGYFTAQPTGLLIDNTTGAIDVGGSQPGTYTITHDIGSNCPATASQIVTIASNATASWTTPGAICSNAGPVDLNDLVTGTPGGSWSGQGVSGGSFHPSGLSGQIPITYAASIGSCTAQSTQSISVQTAIAADAGPDIIACGLTATMQAVSGIGQGIWVLPTGITPYGSVSNPNAEVESSGFGSYALIWSVTNDACTSQDTVAVSFFNPMPDLWANAGTDQSLAVLGHTTLQGSASAGTLLHWWILSGSGSIANPNDSITAVNHLGLGDNLVVLTATANPCASVSDTVLIRVDDLFIPEGYSPNGDGVNDLWAIRGIEAYPGSAVKVFNRWGQQVYSSDDYRNEWDGRSHNGHSLPDDTYFYVLNLTGLRTYNGHVIIKR